jgi:hypothetical protein
MNPEFNKILEEHAYKILQEQWKDCGLNKLLEAEFNDFITFGIKPSVGLKEMVERYGGCLTMEELIEIKKLYL